MATLIAGAAGAAIFGGIFGTAAFLGVSAAAWGFMIGSMLATPKMGDVEGAKLEDLTITNSSYSIPINEVFGTARVGTNLIWAIDLVEHRHEESSSGGGKGPTHGPSQIWYTYSCTFALALCKGPIGHVRRIWADNKLIFDLSRDADADLKAASTKMLNDGKLLFYTGSMDQQPCSLIEQHLGVGNVPAYRGIAYLVWNDLDLNDYGNRIPAFSVEVVVLTATVTVRTTTTTIITQIDGGDGGGDGGGDSE